MIRPTKIGVVSAGYRLRIRNAITMLKRPSASNRVLIDQTCFGRSGGLAPISLPLFQGVRYEDGEHAPPARKVGKDFDFQRVAVIAML